VGTAPREYFLSDEPGRPDGRDSEGLDAFQAVAAALIATLTAAQMDGRSMEMRVTARPGLPESERRVFVGRVPSKGGDS
jgi:hypothetical protein